jgi:flagellar capping protein FliD
MSKNLQEIGLGIINTKKKTVQELSTSLALADIVGGAGSPLFNLTKDFATRLTSAGIKTSDDNTFVIDESKLKRALEINAEETMNILIDEKTGILPLLSQRLEKFLYKGLGDLDQKINQVTAQRKTPSLPIAKLAEFTEVSTLNKTVKNLITIA